jgi:hypothetical protein
MERTEPVNPARKVNLAVKTLLYPQVTTFKVLKAIPSLSNYQKNYHSRGFGFTLIVCIEIIMFWYFFPNVDKIYFNRFLTIIILYHGLLEWIFNKEINIMAFDYYAYYKKPLLYIFLTFMAICFIGLCILAYNSIGHVT